jgi:hypothetical protein
MALSVCRRAETPTSHTISTPMPTKATSAMSASHASTKVISSIAMDGFIGA